MRIAVVGDTHGKIGTVTNDLKLLKPECIFFTGDYYRDGVKIARELNLDLHGVPGNCDHRSRIKAEKTVEIAGKKFFIVHGHQYGVKSGLQRIFYRGQELQVHAVIFGHTHVACCEQIDGLWLLNPGSPTHPRIGAGSYAIINVDEDGLEPVILKM